MCLMSERFSENATPNGLIETVSSVLMRRFAALMSFFLAA